MQDTMIADIDFYNYPSFIFKRKSHIFIEKKTQHFRKSCERCRRKNGNDIDGIGNFEDFPRIVFKD